MRAVHHAVTLLVFLLSGLSLPAQGADRMRPGQWDTTIIVNGKPQTFSACLTQIEADAMNGDVASVRAIVERDIGPSGCKVLKVTATGDVVEVKSSCNGKETVGSTIYRGDSAESTNANGVKTVSKRVGPCK